MSDRNFLKKEKEKKPMNKLVVCVVVLGAILIGLLAGLLILSRDAQHTEVPQMDNPGILAEEETAFEDVALETPYCTLYYSGKWQDYMRTEVISDGIECAVNFYGSAGNEAVYLFSVMFALETENSFPVGVFITADGAGVDVSAEMSEFDPGKKWKQQDVDLICAMQEQLNYVLDNLRATPGFSE